MYILYVCTRGVGSVGGSRHLSLKKLVTFHIKPVQWTKSKQTSKKTEKKPEKNQKKNQYIMLHYIPSSGSFSLLKKPLTVFLGFSKNQSVVYWFTGL